LKECYFTILNCLVNHFFKYCLKYLKMLEKTLNRKEWITVLAV
jgi:hypothetical protein